MRTKNQQQRPAQPRSGLNTAAAQQPPAPPVATTPPRSVRSLSAPRCRTRFCVEISTAQPAPFPPPFQ